MTIRRGAALAALAILVNLGWVGQPVRRHLLADATDLTGFWGWVARLGVPLAAILMSGGFFASSAGKGVTQPNQAMVILWAGAACLAAGTLTLGVGLLLS